MPDWVCKDPELSVELFSSVLYRNKGELELALQKQEWPRLTIVRPSLLLGARHKPRMGEVFAAPFSRVLPGRWRGIEADTVALAMARLAKAPGTGLRIVESDELQQLGR